MNLDLTVDSFAKRYRPETKEWEDSVRLLAKRFTRGQLTKKKKELEGLVQEMVDQTQEMEKSLNDPTVKPAFDTIYRKLELVSAARLFSFQPLQRRWT